MLKDGKRLDSSISNFPDKKGTFKSTKELLQLETIALLCLLRHARDYRSEVYKLWLLTHQATAACGDIEEIQEASYSDYEAATRKVWVIENIITDRIGYYPQKVTKKFLAMYVDRIQNSQHKRMVPKKTIKNGAT